MADDRTLVVGLGKTGLSCVRYLRSLGRSVSAVDSRPSPPGLETMSEQYPEVGITLGGFPEEAFREIAEIVVSPGVSLAEPALERALAAHIPVYGDIELFARAVGETPVAAITGSNGKSTVTSMIAAMLEVDGRRVKVGGNLGMPALDLLKGERPEIYLLELSSFQLETTKTLEPRVAALLNVSPDHMDRYADVETYAAAKRRIFRGRGTMVLNRDDPRVAAMASRERQVVLYTLGPPGPREWGLSSMADGQWLCHGETPLLARDELAVEGLHNVANALAAMAVASVLGTSRAAMVKALAGFRGLPHRCQLVAEAAGVRWFDDSKATNVGATVAAVRGLAPAGPLILIAGGDAKGADFSALREVVREGVRLLVLIGRDAPAIAAAVRGEVTMLGAASMSEAVSIAHRHARPGDNVLLAPACASFDMFASYEERGDAFVAAVREVLGQ